MARAFVDHRAGISGEEEENALVLRPIMTPLMVSGFDRRTLRRMDPVLRKFGFLPVQSGGRVEVGKEVSLRPGSPLAISLITGDMEISGIGTVTYVEKNRVLGFGHDFFWTGEANLPMAGAYVHTVVASQSSSFKLSSPTKIVGRLTDDHRDGIAGTLGERAPMIPCQVEVKAGEKAKKRFRFQVVDNRMLTSSLIGWCVEDAALFAQGLLGEAMVNTHLEVELEGKEKFTRDDIFYAPFQPVFAAHQAMYPVDVFLNNEFERVKVKSVAVKITFTKGRHTATIESMSLDRYGVEPGGTVKATVELRPFEKKPEQITIPYTIPVDTPEGMMTITVCDASTLSSLQRSRAPAKYVPRKFEDIVTILKEEPANTKLALWVALPRQGVTLDGRELPRLPGSLMTMMGMSRKTGLGNLSGGVSLLEETPWVIQGARSLNVFVRRKK